MLFSWSYAACCWVEDCRIPALSAFVLISFLSLVCGGSDVPSDGPLLCVILLLEDILIPLLINSNTYRFWPDNLVSVSAIQTFKYIRIRELGGFTSPISVLS